MDAFFVFPFKGSFAIHNQHKRTREGVILFVENRHQYPMCRYARPCIKIRPGDTAQ